MIFNDHSNIKDQHAFLGASRYHWVNYNDNKLMETYYNYLASQKGVELHDFAAKCIKMGQKLPKSKKTLNLYVNDAIGFRMIPEQTLYFTENCFGTADAILFRNNLLRIHDFKSGVARVASMSQLMIYAALFCLEYKKKPEDLEIELRIYQFDDIAYHIPDPVEITAIMEKARAFDKLIRNVKNEEN